MKIQLLEPEGFPDPARQRLAAIAEVTTHAEADTSEVVAVFTRLARILDRDFHAHYPALRWIISPTTGLNHIDTAYFESQGVEVLSLRGRTEFLDTIRATAEHSLALALALLRKIPAADAAVRDGRWDRYPHKGRELFGKTVLILGYGRIGRQVARLYEAFGCTVRAADCIPERVPPALDCEFRAALPTTDILSIHLPLNASTQGWVSSDMLSRLPATALLVNTSRGEVVDQDALLAALERGDLAGAALDVLIGEPQPLSPDMLRRIQALGDRLLITPHIGGFTFESLEAVETHLTDVFLRAVHARL